MFLLIPHKPLSVSELSSKNTASFFTQDGSSNTGSKPSGNKDNAPSNDKSNVSGSNVNSPADSDVENGTGSASSVQPSNSQASGTEILDANLSGFDPVNRTITVDNDEFYQWLSELFTNMDEYEGYTITITGFVYKDPQYFAENEFTPARLCMTCCTADLSPIGLVCKYSNVSSLEQNSWVTVEGVIHKGQYEGEDEPQISVTKITPAEEVEGYVYPY
jgi:putative membrane protein